MLDSESSRNYKTTGKLSILPRGSLPDVKNKTVKRISIPLEAPLLKNFAKKTSEKSAELELDSMVQSRSSNISGQIEVEYEEER